MDQIVLVILNVKKVLLILKQRGSSRPLEFHQNDDLSQKCMRADQSHANQGVCNYDLDDQMQATRDVEEKFGCNISHLGKYSEIAEKSMGKFMSVIYIIFQMHFNCFSSKRATIPLKDIRNTFR
ncbi:putative exodeoxyribonuclease I [Helianthus anomalus]